VAVKEDIKKVPLQELLLQVVREVEDHQVIHLEVAAILHL
jgi:hypothetical protein